MLIFVIRPTCLRVWQKAVFRWVRSHGQSPHTSGSSENSSGSVGIPLSGRLRRQAINLTPLRRVKAWKDGPSRPEVYPGLSHTRPNCSARHGQPKCDPDTGESHAEKIIECFLSFKAELDYLIFCVRGGLVKYIFLLLQSKCYPVLMYVCVI